MKHARRSRFGLYVAAALWVSALVTAVPSGAAPMDSVPTLDVVRSKLELTPDQETKLKPLFEQRLAELQQTRVRVEQAATKGDKRAVLRDAKQQADGFNSKVEDVLTPSQVTKWRELRAETREKIKQRYHDSHE